MKKLLRTILVVILLVSSVFTFNVFAEGEDDPQSNDLPEEVLTDTGSDSEQDPQDDENVPENESDGQPVLLGQGNGQDEPSYIDLFSYEEGNHSFIYSDEEKSCRWTFFVDPLKVVQAYDQGNPYTVDVYFRDSGKFSSIELGQLFNDQDHEYHVPITKETIDGEEVIKMTLRADNMSLINVRGKTGEQNYDQMHYIETAADQQALMGLSLISTIKKGNQVSWLDYHLFDYRNLRNNILGNLSADVFFEGNTRALVELINGESTTEEKDELAKAYFKLELKAGVSIINTQYSVNMGSGSPIITYTLSDGTNTETVKVRLNGISGDPQESIVIDGKRYIKNMLNEYTVYMREGSQINVDQVLEYTDHRYKTLVFDATVKPSESSLLYEDGAYYKKALTRNLIAYVPKEGEEIRDGMSLSELDRVTDLENKIIVRSELGGEFTYDRAKQMLKERLRVPVGYIDYADDDKLKFIEKRFTDYDDFRNYDGAEPAYYIEPMRLPNGNYILGEQIKTSKLIGLVRYDQLGVNYNPDSSKTGATIILSDVEGNSAADKLENAIHSLEGYTDSTIIIDSDIILDHDVIMDAFRINNISSSRCITIDLQGHTIDAGPYKLELPERCELRFVNNTDVRGKITGNGEVLLKTYGNLMFIGNINIVNDSGIGIAVANDQDGLKIESDIIIKAKTGIKWFERKNGIFSNRNRCNMTITGTIQASDKCIDIELPSPHDGLVYELRLNNNTYQYQDGTAKLTSENIGINVNGSIVSEIRFANFNSPIGFKVNGGTYAMSEVDATCSSDFFLVDSRSENATPVKITFDLEGENDEGRKYWTYNAGNSIVADTAPENESKIKAVNMTTSVTSIHAFKYTDLFRNVPSSTVNINGGYFIDKSFMAYFDPTDVVEEPYSGADKDQKYVVSTEPIYSETYYKISKPEAAEVITNFQQLKDALANINTDILIIGADIDGKDSNGDPQDIDFFVGKSRVFQMNGYTISNVCLRANIDDEELDGSTQLEGELKIINGTITNDKCDTLIIDGAKARLYNASIISENDKAVILYNGSIDANDNSLFKGKEAIHVEIDTDRSGYFGNIYVADSEIISYDAPAIMIESAFDKGPGNYITTYIKNSEVSSEGDAIVLKDPAQISLKNTELSAGNSGVVMKDDAKGTVTLSNSRINAETGVHLTEDGSVRIEGDTYITAQNNAVEMYDKSHIDMYSGHVSAESEIVSYYDGDSGSRRQNIIGGNFNKSVSNRSIGVDPQHNFEYVCLQVNPLEDPYPFAVVKQFNSQVNVYQNISLIIERDIEIDQDQLENAITPEERAALEAEAEKADADETGSRRVDIVFTISPETSSENKDKFPSNLPDDTEYYDVHINKNIGSNKQRVDTVSKYQVFTISLAEITGKEGTSFDKDNIIVYHRHGNGSAKIMKKVAAPTDVSIPQEECYFVTTSGGIDYVNVVTKRFSTFALVKSDEEVESVDPNAVNQIDLRGIYASEYSKGSRPTIPENIVVDGATVSTENITISYGGIDDTVYYSESDFPTEPGTYKVIWTINDTDKNDDYLRVSGSGEFVFVISESVQPVISDDQKPSAINNLKYNGEDQLLVEEPAQLPDGYDSVQYSTDGGKTWSDDIPVGKDAGTYNVSVKYVGDENHEDFVLEDKIEVTIAKAEPPQEIDETLRPKAVSDLVYDGTEQRLVEEPAQLPDGYESVQYSTDGGKTWSDDIPVGKDAGTYNVSVKYVGDDNHENMDFASIMVKIAKDAPDIPAEMEPVANETEYGSDDPAIRVPGVLPNGYAEVQYKVGDDDWSDSLPDLSAGSHEVQVRYVGDKNHEDLTFTVNVEVDKASAPAADELSDDNKASKAETQPYNGEDQPLLEEPAQLPDGYDSVQYSTDGGKTWSDDIPVGKDAGTYNVSVKYVGDENHEDFVLEDTIEVMIAKGDAPAADSLIDDQKPKANDVRYKGDDKSLIEAAKQLPDGYDKVYYSTDGEEWSEEIPQADDSKVPGDSYSVYVKYTGRNLGDLEFGPIEVKVSRLYYADKQDDTYIKGSNKSLSVSIKNSYDDVNTFYMADKIYIDGEETDAANYEKSPGSIVITLKPEYLETLSIERHTVKVSFAVDGVKDGEAEAYFFVSKKTEPSPSDSSSGTSYSIPKTGIE